MTKEEKMDKVAHNFSLLPDEKQDYILGVLQAIAFTRETNVETVPSDLEEDPESVGTKDVPVTEVTLNKNSISLTVSGTET